MKLEELSRMLSEVIYDTVIIGFEDGVLICDIYGEYHYSYRYYPKDIKFYTEKGLLYIICNDYKKSLLKGHFNLDKICL